MRRLTTRLIVIAVVATGGFVTAGAMTSAHAASHVVRIADHAHASSPHTVWRGNTPWG
ncbi:hypothetical protein Ssi03_31120 [Sphaerisporangium siamense]|uniref:Uncharacterized protein n=1 Tax=Sphaerisporangium siamense TaxID=795645 RepID=A0A7W7DEG0_9ACTN|nr:hypothetical protein [Sphaerisporangium siamense]MBB4704196.1 hypothetical protein [Sphaerisporangium siamense]GII85122.1 hypothetical protein Ssi03_31120 [Sphaerisporangium siamense]